MVTQENLLPGQICYKKEKELKLINKYQSVHCRFEIVSDIFSEFGVLSHVCKAQMLAVKTNFTVLISGKRKLHFHRKGLLELCQIFKVDRLVQFKPNISNLLNLYLFLLVHYVFIYCPSNLRCFCPFDYYKQHPFFAS